MDLLNLKFQIQLESSQLFSNCLLYTYAIWIRHVMIRLKVGNGGVGKSSMIQRFATGIFTQEYKKTIGVDFLEKSITMGGLELRLMLWDTAGQEEFHSITRIVIITETKCQVNHCKWYVIIYFI